MLMNEFTQESGIHILNLAAQERGRVDAAARGGGARMLSPSARCGRPPNNVRARGSEYITNTIKPFEELNHKS